MKEEPLHAVPLCSLSSSVVYRSALLLGAVSSGARFPPRPITNATDISMAFDVELGDI